MAKKYRNIQQYSERIYELPMGFYAQDIFKTAVDTIGDIAAYQVFNISSNSEVDTTSIDPDEINDDSNVKFYMDYSELIAPTVAALQFALQKIELLEQKISQLENNS
ncbi:MAG: hypothetical protein IJJ41_06315 [Clostridia bacterium]|nr:hypothetical protein [Clostridia bacterium]